ATQLVDDGDGLDLFGNARDAEALGELVVVRIFLLDLPIERVVLPAREVVRFGRAAVHVERRGDAGDGPARIVGGERFDRGLAGAAARPLRRRAVVRPRPSM